MDFLDPKKQRRNKLTLLLGYVLVTIGIGLAVYLLILVAIGYGFDKKGKIVLNGFVFVSSQPTSANIYVNNSLYSARTDTRMSLPSGTYNVKVAASGYRDWQHQIVVLGKDVQHFDYPFLFPTTLKTRAIGSPVATPEFTTQSPDHRWLLAKTAGEAAELTEYDLKDPAHPVAASLNIPSELVTAGDGAQSWSAVEWSSDNHRLLLLHNYTDGDTAAHEYIMVDRADLSKSVNVTRQLSVPASEVLSLHNKKYNEYYAFDAASGVLRTTSLDNSLQVQQLTHVVAFKSYGSDMLLYVTSDPPTGKAVEGKVSVVLEQGQKTYTLRTLSAGAAQYDLDLASYSGDWYVLAGSTTDNGVYIYKNPQDQTVSPTTALPAPWRLLKLTSPSRVSFSSSAQYIMAESGQQFAIYDAETARTYSYTATQPLDAPQAYAVWMDGNRLTYVSGGKEIVFDYDYQNIQTLQPALPAFAPAFSANYKYLFSMAPVAADQAQANLSSTPLVTNP